MHASRRVFVILVPLLLTLLPAILPGGSAALAIKAIPPTERASGHVVVISAKAPVLLGPGHRYATLEWAMNGEVFNLEGMTGAWYYIRLENDARGWIHGNNLARWDYPEYLMSFRPPDDWVPPTPNWVPPPGWKVPPGWSKRPQGWVPPARWRPEFWVNWAKSLQFAPLVIAPPEESESPQPGPPPPGPPPGPPRPPGPPAGELHY